MSNVKPTELPVASSLNLSDIFAVTQGGTTTKSSTLELLNAFLSPTLRGDVTNPMFGADPTGTTDSTDAIQACIDWLFDNGGGECYLPGGVYRCDGTLTIPVNGARPAGGPAVSMRGEGFDVSIIDASLNLSDDCIYAGNVATYFRDFGIFGPADDAGAQQFKAGLHVQSSDGVLVQGVRVFGFDYGFHMNFVSNLLMYDCRAREARRYNCLLFGHPADLTTAADIIDCLFQVAQAGTLDEGQDNANLVIDGYRTVDVQGCLIDETGTQAGHTSASLIIRGASTDITVQDFRLYTPYRVAGQTDRIAYGIWIADTAQRVSIARGRILPYDLDIGPTDRVPTNTMYIASTASNCILTDVTTLTNGGGDISDNSVSTEWRNVNGVSKKKSQPIAYAATITPDVRSGEDIFVGALTGNLTVNAPGDSTGAALVTGQRLTFHWVQDGTGGRTITLNAVFKSAYVNTGNTASTRGSLTVEYDGTYWVQVGYLGWT